MVKRYTVVIPTDASGDGTGYTPVVSGFVSAIRYAKSTYENGVDVAITANTSGLAILTWTASDDSYPHAPMNTTADAASLYAAAGQAVLCRIPVADEAIKIVVSQASATTARTGTFHVYIDGV
jgi:hypothetical protein